MTNLARSNDYRQHEGLAADADVTAAPTCTRCGGPTADTPAAPKQIAPAVVRIRWLAARPSNAFCDHPACHSHAADPCDEYRRAAAREGRAVAMARADFDRATDLVAPAIDNALTAHHEAAHFIVHASIGFPETPQIRIRLIAGIDGGAAEAGKYWGGQLSEPLEEGWMALAGTCAEAIYAPDTYDVMDFLGSDDHRRALHAISLLVGQADADLELDRQWRYVETLVRRRWRYVERVATALLSSPGRELFSDDLRALRPPAKIPHRYTVETERFRRKERA